MQTEKPVIVTTATILLPSSRSFGKVERFYRYPACRILCVCVSSIILCIETQYLDVCIPGDGKYRWNPQVIDHNTSLFESTFWSSPSHTRCTQKKGWPAWIPCKFGLGSKDSIKFDYDSYLYYIYTLYMFSTCSYDVATGFSLPAEGAPWRPATRPRWERICSGTPVLPPWSRSMVKPAKSRMETNNFPNFSNMIQHDPTWSTATCL